MSEDLLEIDIHVREELFFSFHIRLYDESFWGLVCLSSCKDRYSFSLGKIAFIFEFWFLRRK